MDQASMEASGVSDRWTVVTPVLCAVHCAATPLLVAAVPGLSAGASVEWSLLGVTVVLAGLAVTQNLGRRGVALPVLLVLMGVSLWLASLLEFFRPVPEDVSTSFAALIAASGLVWMSRSRTLEANQCRCGACDERGESPLPRLDQS